MKVLVTGFDPFGGETVNPAFLAVKQLPKTIAGAQVCKLELPTSFERSVSVLKEAIRQERPDVVLSVGQAGGRSCVTLERVAINLAEARIPDNDGNCPLGTPLEPGGPAAYYATIPVKAAVEAVRAEGLPCHLSYTAGTYVCNAVMYHLLHLCAEQDPNTRAGFAHVPYIPSQVVNKPNGTPSMALADIVKSLEIILATAVSVTEDLNSDAGETH